MNSSIGAFFEALVAVILLALFPASTFYTVNAVMAFCASTKPCVAPAAGIVSDGFIYVVTTVSGLVSALVIARLNVTERGKTPTVAAFQFESRAAVTAATTVVGLYLLASIATGLAALVVGVMLNPKVDQTLSDIGSTWLGLAVAAAYAYFGITPTQSRNEGAASTEGLAPSANGDLTLGKKVPMGPKSQRPEGSRKR